VDLVSQLFDTSSFPARWYCGDWTALHGWLHILSDLGVWSAYLAIPLVLTFFLMRRKDLPFRMIFLLFGAFILSCGTTHLMEAIIFWWPVYRLAGLIKLGTALVSWTTVLALVRVAPQALAMRSPEELQREIDARIRAELELHRVNQGLERRVEERTAELARTNAVLHGERERFRTTLASIGDAVIATDTDGLVSYANPVALAMTGWNEAATQGKPLQEVFTVIHEGTREPADDPAVRVMRAGTAMGPQDNLVLISRSGNEYPIDETAAPIRDERGRVDGVVLVFRDVTARRRADEALKEANRNKDEFLALLAHELRNPLAPIRNSLQVMRLAGENGEVLAWVRGIMERQLGHMVRLIDDLLDVSRITRGKVELRRALLDVSQVVETALETSRPLIEAAAHRLDVKLPPRALLLDGDLTRLAQVVSNLLNNAAKYTPSGGRIELAVESRDREAILSVRDDGIGIPPDQIERIFEMFTQVDRNRDRAQGGLGIGLTLVRKLVEMHGGTVEARSEGEDKGSEFVIRLPLAPDDMGLDGYAGHGRTLDAAQPAGRRILVVDDSKDSAMSLAMLLRIMGNEVRTAADGPSALVLAPAFRPDVVLLDIGMPGMSGYEVARRMRQMPELKPAVLVAQTGWGQQEDLRRSAECGFAAHLVKPIDPAALEELLRKLPHPGETAVS
jgi:PAS domain S-box-containing protein